MVDIYVYMWLSFSLQKEGNDIIYDEVDKPGEHYVKLNKPDRERQILHGAP